MSDAYHCRGDQMFYLLVKVSFAYLLPAVRFCDNFVQCYSVLSDFHPMANDDYVTWLGEFSGKLFYLHEVTSLGEIAKTCSYLPYINLNILNWSGLSVLWQTNGYIGYF